MSYNYHIRNQNILFPICFPQKTWKKHEKIHPPKTVRDLVTWGHTDHVAPQEQRGQARTELAQLEAEVRKNGWSSPAEIIQKWDLT